VTTTPISSLSKVVGASFARPSFYELSAEQGGAAHESKGGRTDTSGENGGNRPGVDGGGKQTARARCLEESKVARNTKAIRPEPITLDVLL